MDYLLEFEHLEVSFTMNFKQSFISEIKTSYYYGTYKLNLVILFLICMNYTVIKKITLFSVQHIFRRWFQYFILLSTTLFYRRTHQANAYSSLRINWKCMYHDFDTMCIYCTNYLLSVPKNAYKFKYYI